MVGGGEFWGVVGVGFPFVRIVSEEGFEDDGGAVGEAAEEGTAGDGGEWFDAPGAGTGKLEGVGFVEEEGKAFAVGAGVPVEVFVAVGFAVCGVEVEFDGEGDAEAFEFASKPLHGGGVGVALVFWDEGGGDAVLGEEGLELDANGEVVGVFCDAAVGECAIVSRAGMADADGNVVLHGGEK